MLLPGRLLYGWLVSDYSLVVSDGMEGLRNAIREAREEVLHIAGKNEAVPDKDLIGVRVLRDNLIFGCAAIQVASLKCCTMIGCPTCSLFFPEWQCRNRSGV